MVSFLILSKAKMKNDRPIVPLKCYWINDYVMGDGDHVMIAVRDACAFRNIFGGHTENQKRP